MRKTHLPARELFLPPRVDFLLCDLLDIKNNLIETVKSTSFLLVL